MGWRALGVGSDAARVAFCAIPSILETSPCERTVGKLRCLTCREGLVQSSWLDRTTDWPSFSLLLLQGLEQGLGKTSPSSAINLWQEIENLHLGIILP